MSACANPMRTLSAGASCVSPLVLEHGEYRLEYPLQGERLAQAYGLRAQVFCRELEWVGTPWHYTETDAFDESVWHLGLSTNGQLVAYLRIHPAWTPWMLDTVFAEAVPPGAAPRRPGACEASRLAVSPAFRHTRFSGGQSAASLILQLLYTVCALNQIDKTYVIVTARALRSLRLLGLPCRAWKETLEVAHRDAPMFATIDWEELRDSRDPVIARRRPAFLATAARARLVVRQAWRAAPD